MTAADFIHEIEAYYGKYDREATKGYVYQWAAEVEYALDTLWPALLKDFSGQYGKAPDIAALEKSAKQFDDTNAWGIGISWRRELRAKDAPPALPGPGVISTKEYDARIQQIRDEQLSWRAQQEVAEGEKADVHMVQELADKTTLQDRIERQALFARQAAELEGRQT